MQLAPGEDLAVRLQKGAIPVDEALHIARQIAEALEAAHEQGIVHRDLKPANILIGHDGDVKIADFGIALDSTGPALTMTGHAMGSPPYMSPEQMMGDTVDSRTDLFNLGVILYEMVTGDVPFAAHDPEEGIGLLQRVKRGNYVPLHKSGVRTPRWLRKMVERCLRAKAKRRPSDVADLRRELEKRVGAPSPADVREDIADHLWDPVLLAAEAKATIQIGPGELERLQRTGRSGVRWYRHLLDVAALLVILLAAAWFFRPQISVALAEYGWSSAHDAKAARFLRTAGEKLGLRAAGSETVELPPHSPVLEWTDEVLARADSVCVDEAAGR
jgi:hypothetical protein